MRTVENLDSLILQDEELLKRLINSRDADELHDAKCTVLKDFHAIYAHDASPSDILTVRKRKVILFRKRYCYRI